MTLFSATRRFAMGAVLSGVGVCLVGGCASSDRPKEVPKAALYKAGGDERIVYVTDQDGTLYVTEDRSNSVLYSGRVARGDRVVVDPDADRLTVNERVVYSKDIPLRMHRIFVLPGDGPAPVTPGGTARGRDIPRPEGVPLTASLGGEGEDRIEFAAPDDGTVWVADAEARREDPILYTAPVRRGQRVTVNPEKDQILIDGQIVYEKDLPERNRRIFFVREPARRDDLPAAPGAGGAARWDEIRDRPAAPAVGQPGEIPETAVLRGDQPGAQDFVADADGTVWVVNATTGRIAYSGPVRRNDRIQVTPATNEITLNGRRANAVGLSGDRYRVYFRPSTAP